MAAMNRCEAPYGTCIAPVAHPGREVPMELLVDAHTVTCPACDEYERVVLHGGYAPDDFRTLLHRAIRIIERNDVTPDERACVARELRRVRDKLKG